MLVHCDCNDCAALIADETLVADLLAPIAPNCYRQHLNMHLRPTSPRWHTQQRLDDARKRQLPQYRTVYSLASARAERRVNKIAKARVYVKVAHSQPHS